MVPLSVDRVRRRHGGGISVLVACLRASHGRSRSDSGLLLPHAHADPRRKAEEQERDDAGTNADTNSRGLGKRRLVGVGVADVVAHGPGDVEDGRGGEAGVGRDGGEAGRQRGRSDIVAEVGEAGGLVLDGRGEFVVAAGWWECQWRIFGKGGGLRRTAHPLGRDGVVVVGTLGEQGLYAIGGDGETACAAGDSVAFVDAAAAACCGSAAACRDGVVEGDAPWATLGAVGHAADEGGVVDDIARADEGV